MPHKQAQDENRRGIGRLVYSVDSEAVLEQREEHARASAEVTEASKESFPASDPPEFTGAAADGPDEKPPVSA